MSAPAAAAEAVSALVCGGCGWQAPADARLPLRCAHAGSDDRDHVLEHRLPTGLALDAGEDPNPFVRWRHALWAWHAAQRQGMADADFVALVRRIDAAVAGVDDSGQGFRVTPYAVCGTLGARLGIDCWVKDETGHVGGSHKARHLMGLQLALAVTQQPGESQPPLAIASCGNAALAAAVLARAADRALQVYVPPDAEPAVLVKLRELGATVVTCPRAPGETGDPCLRAFRRAVAEQGALPFCCQGNENALTIDGGQTLALELIASGAPPLDHLVVQVGGGALASACAQACARAQAAGLVQRLPRLHAVQTQGAAPLARAWGRVQQRVADMGLGVEHALDDAAAHRSRFMWPWETPPQSIAGGILDDETYDWLAVLRGIAASGGSTVVVDEATLIEANALARETTGLQPSHTGSAGLAGVLQLLRDGVIAPGERVGVLMTGVQR